MHRNGERKVWFINNFCYLRIFILLPYSKRKDKYPFSLSPRGIKQIKIRWRRDANMPLEFRYLATIAVSESVAVIIPIGVKVSVRVDRAVRISITIRVPETVGVQKPISIVGPITIFISIAIG
jgi:hypothetical protein